MIVVTHTNGVVVKVSPEQIPSIEGTYLIDALFLLSKTNPQSLLVWCNFACASSLNTKKIKSLFQHDRLMMSYSVSGKYSIPETIGYIEDSTFLKINRKVRYPTWLMSSDVGMIHGSILGLFQRFSIKADPDYVLSSIAKMGQRNGLLCYSNPELLNTAGAPAEVSSIDTTTANLFKFIFQHYKTRWMFLMLLNYLLFRTKISLGKVSVKINEKFLEKAIDVIIPTIGRKQYLFDVLKDLANQTLLPKKVIIVEQNPNIYSQTELDYLIKQEWPFLVSHEFIHQVGACNARNLAIQKIESDWVFMADDDIRFPENTLEKTVGFLENYNAKVATISCLRDGDLEKESDVIQWHSFGSGCSVVSSEAVKSTFFHMAYEHGFGEDRDYGMQLRNKGYDVLYNPFIKLKHLKAAMGGFRKPIERPWELSNIHPKPSPTVMLYRQKHTTSFQLKGYKLRLFVKFYNEHQIKNPIVYVQKMKKAWNRSLVWANKLDEL
jgi:glycosyltransferase involved in cell wall biosynthesis